MNIFIHIGRKVVLLLLQSMATNCHHFFQKKKLQKIDNLGTYTQKVLVLDYNKTKQK